MLTTRTVFIKLSTTNTKWKFFPSLFQKSMNHFLLFSMCSIKFVWCHKTSIPFVSPFTTNLRIYIWAFVIFFVRHRKNEGNNNTSIIILWQTAFLKSILYHLSPHSIFFYSLHIFPKSMIRYFTVNYTIFQSGYLSSIYHCTDTYLFHV